MTCANKGRLMLGSDCIKDEQKECVVIETDLHLLFFCILLTVHPEAILDLQPT
jgi:hypothetical protein